MDNAKTLEMYINKNEGLSRVLGNNALYAKMLKSLLEKPYFTDLVLALEKSDFITAQQNAHSIKGVAANLALPKLHQKMAELESQLKEGQTEDLKQDDIAECINDTVYFIKKLIE